MRLQDAQSKAAVRPSVPPFVETTTYHRIGQKVDLLGAIGGLGYLVGPTGIGKTTAIVQIARKLSERREGSSAGYFRCTASTRDTRAVLAGARESLAISEHVPRQVLRAVRDRCAGFGSDAQLFLFVDEAQHLTRGALSTLRSMSDDGLRVVLCGNRSTLGERLSWGGNDLRSEQAWKDEWDQVWSRSVFALQLDKPAREDVFAFVAACGVTPDDKAVHALLFHVSQGGEGLRRVATLLKTALHDPNGWPYDRDFLARLWDEQQVHDRPRGLA